MQALQILKMARLETQGRRRRRRPIDLEPRTGAQVLTQEEALRTAIKKMRRGGVDLDRVPQEARDLLLAARMPVEDNPAFRPRGKRR